VTALAGFPGGTTLYLRADGTWATPPGGTGAGHRCVVLGLDSA
jgi:hypothetical protein